MSQAKKQTETKNETNYVSDSLVETVWNQYELALDRSRKRREQRYDAYLNWVKQTNKFNGEFRNMVRGFYKETRNANLELIKGVSNNLTNKMENEPKETTKQIRNQWKDAAAKYEEISLSPIKQSIDMVERLEKSAEQGAEAYVNTLKQSGNAWSSVTDEYVKLLKNQNKQVARRMEDSFRTLVRN